MVLYFFCLLTVSILVLSFSSFLCSHYYYQYLLNNIKRPKVIGEIFGRRVQFLSILIHQFEIGGNRIKIRGCYINPWFVVRMFVFSFLLKPISLHSILPLSLLFGVLLFGVILFEGLSLGGVQTT